MWTARASFCLLMLFHGAHGHGQIVVTEGTNIVADGHATEGIVFDLLGGLWTLPDGASAATVLLDPETGARRPFWSPNGQQILFENAVTSDVSVLQVETGQTIALGPGQHPRWHPDGERILFVAAGRAGLSQLFEIDLATGLRWQLTHSDIPVREGVWSADGEQLAYVVEDALGFELRLRGPQGVRLLTRSRERLSSLAFRPDGSLVTFVQHGAALTMEMAILSTPVLVRTLIQEDDLFDAPIAWRSRQRMLYTANGGLRKRQFDSWTPRRIPFRAVLHAAADDGPRYLLPQKETSGEPWVLRVSKFFDGRSARLRAAADIVIQGERILAIEVPGPRPNMQIINMGQAIAIPGLIDACGRPPADDLEARALLARGILTLVPNVAVDAEIERPLAPRLLSPDCSEAIAKKRYVKQQLARISPAGIEYGDARLRGAAPQTVFLSGIARAPATSPPDPFSDIAFTASPVAGELALASATNQWPRTLAALAELNALSGGPRGALDALKAATGTAAHYLGLRGDIGVLEAGARADIVLLAEDPSKDLAALQAQIAIVLRGRLVGHAALSSE